MSPRGFVAALSRFSRPSRHQDRQHLRGRSAPRRTRLAAEPLESRCMLATTATLSGDISPFTRIPVTFLRPDGSSSTSNAYVGQLSWSGMSGDAAGLGVPAAFKSFCIEGLQSVSPGSNSYDKVMPLATSTLLGSTRAGLLADFWQQYGPSGSSGFTDNTDSAAFQLAVWEIINDGQPSGPAGNKVAFDLTAGQFSVGLAGRSLPAAVRAFQWLAGFDTTALGRSSVALYALANPTKQDQVVAVPVVDLDVDSDNSGTIARSSFEDRIEADPALPGLIVPVGGGRSQMIVDAPAGRTATLTITQGADKVEVYTNDGQRVLWSTSTSLSLPAQTGTTRGPVSFWIEAVAPSTSLADIAFTLTTTGTGPASSDTVRVTAVAVDLDVDSNNDGRIDPNNGPTGTDDRIEEESSGRIIFVNSDDDNRNGVADVLDVGRISGENDLAEIVVAALPSVGSGVGSLIVTYDETMIRLYARSDRSGGIVSGSPVAAGGLLYAEGRSAGTSLVTVTLTVNAVRVTDVVRLTVRPYPGSIDVDIDSDNNDDIAHPQQSEWEEILEDHPYGIGKLIMLDNPQRAVTPIVLQMPTGLPAKGGSVRVRIDWHDEGVAGSVRLWNRPVIDDFRNPASVDEGGDRILPGKSYKLSDLRYDEENGVIVIYAEGIKENEALKTLAGVEAAPQVDERIRGTLVVNGDDAAFDDVKYIVANEDSFYYALHTRQEVRNALASRGVYEFADMPKFGLESKSPLDLLRLGVPDDANLLLGDGSGVAGFKAMVYQDYITGDRQYVLAFAGTDDLSVDWYNNFVQGFGYGAPEQYVAAMLIGDGLSRSRGIPAGHLIATGHSLGGGLASAAAVVGGIQADAFNAAWLRRETLMQEDGFGGKRERYAGSLARFAAANDWVDAYYVDYDIITAAQGVYRRADEGLAPVATLQELDGPRDLDMVLGIAAIGQAVTSGNLAGLGASALYVITVMGRLHKTESVLYGLLVTEATFSSPEVDMLGYSFTFF